MPLPQPRIRYRVRKRGRRHWDCPRHFVGCALLGIFVGLLMSWGFLEEYAPGPAIVLAWSDPSAPHCPPVDCCVKPK